MTTTVEAIYENGRLVLPQPLPLPEKTLVLVTIKTTTPGSDSERGAWLKFSDLLAILLQPVPQLKLVRGLIR